MPAVPCSVQAASMSVPRHAGTLVFARALSLGDQREVGGSSCESGWVRIGAVLVALWKLSESDAEVGARKLS